MAWTSSRRVDAEKLFIRVNHQCLPNLSFHSYLFEDGTEKKYFTRLHMSRWTVPVDDTNSIMFGWRVIGANIDPRDIGKKHMVGFESMDFLEGQVGMRRPEREAYGQGELPPIPKHHRERPCYKDAQYAPGDYEAICSQRPIAVHALENPMKVDAGVYMFRKLLRDAVRGENPGASAAAWREWLQTSPINSYCSGNVLEIPEAPTLEAEIERRRIAAQQVISATTESDALEGEERAAFMRQKLLDIQNDFR